MGSVNPSVDLRRDGEVAIVTIDNPPVNALKHEVRAGLDPPTAIGERSPLLARSQRPTRLDNPRVPSSPALAAVHSSRGSGGMPRMDDELHIAVEEVEEADKLAETLPRVGRIEQPI